MPDSLSTSETKRPAGTYVCPECGGATITYHTPVDKFKLRCPKCSTDMVRQTTYVMDRLVKIYGRDKKFARLEAAVAGVNINEVAFQFGFRKGKDGQKTTVSTAAKTTS